MSNTTLNDVNSHTDLDDLIHPSRFSSLPKDFFAPVSPTPLSKPYLIGINQDAVTEFNLSDSIHDHPDFIARFTGNSVSKKAIPIASVYSGHQFGVWAGQLGDGRALLLGDALNQERQTVEIQLKGAGITPFSRMGDGRAVLRSSIREFLCSEAMFGLGIPTSRALCITGSDQYVMRETPETSAVVARYAPSFIRFGSFEHWYYNQRPDELKALADFTLTHYYPELQGLANPYKALLTQVTEKTAKLIAQWQSVGFMHGVMNTDNMSILGLTIDYGPFGFMEAYDMNHICNHSDHQGRYAYHMQPTIGHWNCHALAQALLPLIGSIEETQEALNSYKVSYETQWELLLQQKFGLSEHQDHDLDLFESFFQLLQANHADMTLSFRYLSKINNQMSANDEALRDLFIDRNALNEWLKLYRDRLMSENSDEKKRHQIMQARNPKYILRNYLAQIAIEKAQKKDFSEIAKLLAILKNPYLEQDEYDDYAQLPPDWAKNLEVSCSS
ncbi:protein adenylyltransferase SelO [Undibacterium sp. SXout7W]|uniref:protein adenylyltransferase SelO n=1 Tax=Undibacterium sp. SXout7W TaxID=3413049 RepID=UPI003BF297F1